MLFCCMGPPTSEEDVVHIDLQKAYRCFLLRFLFEPREQLGRGCLGNSDTRGPIVIHLAVHLHPQNGVEKRADGEAVWCFRSDMPVDTSSNLRLRLNRPE